MRVRAGELGSVGRHVRLAKTFVINLCVALAIFTFAVAVDFFAIKRPSVELEMFVLIPLSFLQFVLVPTTFWLVNRHTFVSKHHAEARRLGLAAALAVLFWMLALLPFLEVHALMGGTE